MAYVTCLNPMAIPFHPEKEKMTLPSKPFELNHDAKEFIPCRALSGDNPCPEQDTGKTPYVPSTSKSGNLSNNEDSATGDESGLESEDSDDSDGEIIVLIGSRPDGFDSGEAITTPSKSDSKSRVDLKIVVSELNPDAQTFLPKYWIPISSNERLDSKPESSDSPQQLQAEETKHGSQEQFHSCWEAMTNSIENVVNGVILSNDKYIVVSQSVEDDDGDLSYDLVYGLVGYVYVPN